MSLSTGTSGAAIHYTVDGSDPTTASTLYTAPFQVAVDTTVKARAFLAGYNDSPVSSAVFQIQARLLPTGLVDYWKLDETGGSCLYLYGSAGPFVPGEIQDTYLHCIIIGRV